MVKQTFKVGDRVGYSKAWLQSTCQYTGDVPFARGVITALQPLGDNVLATIEWDAGFDMLGKVMCCNLWKVGTNNDA
jgi:hypothetical protein